MGGLSHSTTAMITKAPQTKGYHQKLEVSLCPFHDTGWHAVLSIDSKFEAEDVHLERPRKSLRLVNTEERRRPCRIQP